LYIAFDVKKTILIMWSPSQTVPLGLNQKNMSCVYLCSRHQMTLFMIFSLYLCLLDITLVACQNR